MLPAVYLAIYLIALVTVFDLYGTERLNEWKRIRDQLESSDSPLLLVADLWSRAPFVNTYLDPACPNSWPDPWHLILDGRFDELAIALGMLYTLKLTDRFMGTFFEIHTAVSRIDSTPRFFLVVDNKHVLNYEPRAVLEFDSLPDQSSIIWSTNQIQ